MNSPQSALPRLILFSRSVHEPALVEQMNLDLSASPEFHYRYAKTLDELREIVSHSTRAVVLANCLTKEDIADLYNVLPEFEDRVKEGTFRWLVLNSIQHPKLGDLLRSRGALELIDLPITQKALQYRMRNLLLFVHQNYLKQDANRNGSEPLEVGRDKKQTLRARPKTPGLDILWQPPVEFDSDFWFIPTVKHIRHVVGVWLVDMIGPSPSAGSWEEWPGGERAGEKAWKWRPREGAPTAFAPKGGSWVFFGKPPEFSWQRNLWSFVSKFPLLGFFPDDRRLPNYTRFEFRSDEGLIFFENSATTRAFLPLIESTLQGRSDFQDEEEDLEEESEAELGFENFVLPETQAPEDESPTPIAGPTVLTPAERTASILGLQAVKNAGVSAGARTFDTVHIGVDVMRKSGVDLSQSATPVKAKQVYDVTKTGATVMLEPSAAQVGDRFLFRLHFDSGEIRSECMMEWELTQIELELERQLLASGEFISGDFVPLARMIDQVAERRKELKEFYQAARG